MTLIVSVVAGVWGFHASDRVISVEPTPDNPTGEFDRHSNKTIIVVGTDCWLALGYSGIAFLDGRPTDRLIAEAICGSELRPKSMLIPWQMPPNLHYREIRDRVENRLKDAYSRLPESEKLHSTQVLASGLQRKGSQLTKVMFRTRVKGNTATSIEKRPATQKFESVTIDAVGMVYNDIISRARDRISAIGGSREEVPDRVRDILKDAVLETSKRTPKVGDNVMTVVLDKPGQAIRTGLHITDQQRQDELFETALKTASPEKRERFAQMLTVSTPYVFLPDAIWSPSIGNPNAWSPMNGGITFDYTGFDGQPASKDGAFLYFGSQPRRD